MSSRFNQRARLARRGMRGRGGVLRAPSAKQGSTSSSFASTQRDKGGERRREREIWIGEGGWSFRSGWYPLAMLTRMPNGPRGGFFFVFSPVFFLPSFLSFFLSLCFPFWRTHSMASVHDHAYVCNDGKKGGGKTICALEWILLTVRRWKVGYLVELLARSPERDFVYVR